MSDPTDDYQIIHSPVLYSLTTIYLYNETVQHMLDRHPDVPWELPVMMAAVTAAVVRPTLVEVHKPNTYMFVDMNSTNRSGDPLRVAVKQVTQTSGRVTTAFFATMPTKPIVWRAGDEPGSS